MKTNKLFLPLLALSLSLACAFGADTSATSKQSDTPEATTYQIRNAKYHDLLRPRDANNADGTPIVLYSAQPWKCMTWRLQPATNVDSAFVLKNLFTGKTFHADADTNAAPRFVTQTPLAKGGGESPAWQVIKLTDGSYKIIEPKSGHALTAVLADGASAARITIGPWEDKAEQKWQLEKMDPKNLTM